MIDADTGNIHLPNGFVITPALTLDDLRQSRFGRDAVPNRPASAPGYCWFLLEAGKLDEFRLSVQLSFVGQILSSVCLSCRVFVFDDDGLGSLRLAKDEESFEDALLKEEVKVKCFHDALLNEDLGETKILAKTSRDDPGLDKAPNCLLSWGKVVSNFDDGGGDAYISIKYDNR